MANNQQMIKLVRKTLRHMSHTAQGHQKGGILLAGDPGIGKTTFVKMLGKLLGMRTIIIEVPHVTEEHLINIPFVVFDTSSETGKSQTSQLKQAEEYKMVLADSNLYTQLTTSPIMSDQDYLKYMQTAPAVIQHIFTQLGGNATTIPPEIAKARSQHKIVLFLDEFYRTTTTRIRNIMRGMLNGNIGKHKIPANVYTIYASNMRDSGIDETPSNAQFTQITYKASGADDWLDYLVAQYETDEHIKLNDSVIEKFREILKDEDLSHTDVNAEVRTSPRRWEQLLIYINASIPCNNVSEARALITNVKNNFVHYETGKHSALHEKVLDAVIELIKETSGINVTPGDKLEEHDWRDQLDHYIMVQIKTNNKRKHIPLLSGPPGIGKTSDAERVAAHHNLRLIEIDVGKLFADDVIGLPIPGKRDEDHMTVQFSMPMLYNLMMTEIKDKDKAYLEALAQEKDKAAAQKEAADYGKQKHKYLVFFDELNRVDEKTFNSMRRVILEKSFGEVGKHGEELRVPDEALVVGAINPEGVGTMPMTEHFRDVVDVIPAQPAWAKTRAYLMGKNMNEPVELKEAAIQIIELLIKKFKTTNAERKDSVRAFHLNIAGTEMYLAPREFTDMFTTLIREMHAAITDALNDDDVKEDEVRSRVDEAIADALEDTLNFPLQKAGIDGEEFLNILRLWVEKLPDAIFGNMLSKKVKNANSVGGTLEKYLDGHDLTQVVNDHHFINANTNTSSDDTVMEEVKEALRAKIVDDASVQKYILDESHPAVVLDGDQLKLDSSKKVSHITNFFHALVYALHVHQYSYNRLNAVCKSLSQMMSELNKTLKKDKKVSPEVAMDAQGITVGLRGDLHDLVQGLQ